MIDRYEVLELLGSGGLSEVYRALDRKLLRCVALKILTASSDAEGRAMLLREARSLAAILHPNLVAIHDLGEVVAPGVHQGLGYIVMELVVGRSLRTHVRDRAVPHAERVRWLREIARALLAAHDAGIVHHDVKPENVMIGLDGVAKVLDFGAARRAETSSELWSVEEHNFPTIAPDSPASSTPLSQAGSTGGTPHYMAPEQLRGESTDGRTDQFAWGIVAYELLTGTFPWNRRGGTLAVASRILSIEPEPIDSIDPTISRGLADVIHRALEKRPEARFARMADVLEALAPAEHDDASARRHDAPRAACHDGPRRSAGFGGALRRSLNRTVSELASALAARAGH